MTDRVETPKQLAERVGLSQRQVRHLIQNGELDHVMVGSRVHIPADAWPQFLQRKRRRAKEWDDETKVLSCDGSQSANVTTSLGLTKGRSRERSTGTSDREQAEAIFGEWLQARGRRTGPRDPIEILVTEMLTEYAIAKSDEVMAPRVIGCAIAHGLIGRADHFKILRRNHAVSR